MDFSNAITDKCEGASSGEVELSFIVDASGQPRNIIFIHPLGNDLDKLALVVVGADRFKPGAQNETPVAVGRSVKIHLDVCNVDIRDESGQTVKRLRLNSQPVQKIDAMPESPTEAILGPIPSPNDLLNPYHVGGSVRPAIPIVWPQAEYTQQARKKRIDGAARLVWSSMLREWLRNRG